MNEEALASVIIPVWRDEPALGSLLRSLSVPANAEVIVATVLGEDSRYTALRERSPGVRWIQGPRGRAVQMNAGASAARGRWLLFLHADSRLPADWLDAIAEVEAAGDVVAGAFRLALDSGDWRARVIEQGVRLRVALFGLPYGDQALFVRRGVFEALGGYRDLPLMEDIDLVKRLRAAGRLHRSRTSVITSARRWQRDGWANRSARNLTLAARFLLGAPPARLAQHYFGRRPGAVVMMARAPWTPGKTRIGVTVDEHALAQLRHALFEDTLEVLRSVPKVDFIVACEPADASERMREVVPAGVDVIAQRGADLGERLARAFEDTFRLGAESVVVVGSDLPDLPASRVGDAFDRLRSGAKTVVLGPAADGGYYLIGMNRPHPQLFTGIDWSTSRVLAQTLDAAKAQNLGAVLLEGWADVDAAADLDRLEHSAAGAAARTRAWRLEHVAALESPPRIDEHP